ncbi:unnamed protein product [Somion occarium]|uniref:choline-phosphate cytidylyltransferase n=1 Tax=Somion occarium TaxID=3059160 RepID=A0ABP1E448_9APHY
MRRSIDAISVLSNDDLADYDVISDGIRSLESSIADLGIVDRKANDENHEPGPSQGAKNIYMTPGLTVEEIQAYVQKAMGTTGLSLTRNNDVSRPVRVYVDGHFDGFNTAHALQLRQAKLSFPSVCVIVGVHSDDICRENGYQTSVPHLERCELMRHCRWVDEVAPEAPWRLDERFLRARCIDYVAIDEGTSIDPSFDKEKLKGYDLVKKLRKAIPTRRTTGICERKYNATPVQTTSRTSVSFPSAIGIHPFEGGSKDSEKVDKDQDDPFQEPRVDEFGAGNGV